MVQLFGWLNLFHEIRAQVFQQNLSVILGVNFKIFVKKFAVDSEVFLARLWNTYDFRVLSGKNDLVDHHLRQLPVQAVVKLTVAVEVVVGSDSQIVLSPVLLDERTLRGCVLRSPGVLILIVV